MGLAPGKQFEADFKSSIPDRCDVTRLKDAGGWSRGSDLRFTPKNPCDFIIFSKSKKLGYSSVMYKIELKSTDQKSLPFANIRPKTDKLTARENSIKFTKVLVESEKKGVFACFIVNFRSTNQTYRVKASDVLKFLENAERQSIPIDWFEKHCPLIKQTLKIKHYRYDLEWL